MRLFGSASDRYSYKHLVPLFKSIQELVETGKLPGAVLTLIGKGDVILQRQFGFASLEGEPRPVRHDTIFDLGSLTTVLATTTATMMLVERGDLYLGSSVGKYLPLPKPEKSAITIWHLLTHTSGLPESIDLSELGEEAHDLAQAVYEVPLQGAPGQQVLYSEVGFMWLKDIVERVTDQDFNSFFRQEIVTPLELRDTQFTPPALLRGRIAATRYDEETQEYLCGVPYDPNARAFGGVAGHAGLFSTGGDVARFVLHLLSQERGRGAQLLTTETIGLMTRNHTDGLGERRGFGWALKDPVGSTAGDLMTARAFGHAAAIGPSLWVDPERDMAIVFLANWPHLADETWAETRDELRPSLHNAATNAFLRGR